MVNRNMLLSVTVIAILALSAAGAWASEDTNDGGGTHILNAGEYEIAEDGNGFDILQMEGFPLAVLPGNPMLPHKNYDILVPADAIESSIELKIISSETSILGGDYKIESASRMLSGTEDWQNDKTVNVYDTDANFPENSVEILPCSQMRKWKFVRIDFTPFQYNPVSKELALTESVEIEISYSRDSAKSYEKNDMVMDDIAPQIFLNYEEARGWYGPEDAIAPQQAHDYVIITTNAIEASSTKLSSFVTHKQNIGHSVLVVTEDDFGGLTGQAPNHRAEKIRQWLINNYAAMWIEYVLLIGDPSPYESVGMAEDIPMKMCHPEMNQVEYDCEPTPTDYFYADLTGNWDIDGDWYYGEWIHDYPVPGGVDFTPEVYVGRIPVYDEEYTTLDSILQKIIDYGTEPETSVTPGDISWRESILMPMGFQASGYDGAMLAEQMKDDYLGAAGFSSWRMYQQGNGACSLDSTHTSEEELRGRPNTPNVRNRWSSNDFGIVAWWGHGNPTQAVVGYNDPPSYCVDGMLLESPDCSVLDDTHPAFTYQCSCTNGYPEYSDNLQYAILKQGGIATVSATRPSWFSPDVGYGEFDGSQTNSGIGYEYVDRLVQEMTGGRALYQTKQSMTPNHQCYLMNWYDFNLYGDPATSIISSGAGDPNSITNIGLSPPSPAWLDFNEHVDITFDYSTNEASGVRIFVRPYTGGSLTPNYAAHGSPLYPYPGGSGSGWFTITSGAVTVDQLRFQMLNADQSVLLLDFFIDVDYHFGEEPECKVLFDETHSPSGNGPGSYTIEDIFSEWAALLESQGMTVESITTGPITYDVLKNYGVVVIPEPTEDYTDAEINAIKQYVNNGGGLLILGEWGPFATGQGIYPVVNEIAAEFDMVFNDDTVYDPMHHDGSNSLS